MAGYDSGKMWGVLDKWDSSSYMLSNNQKLSIRQGTCEI